MFVSSSVEKVMGVEIKRLARIWRGFGSRRRAYLCFLLSTAIAKDNHLQSKIAKENHLQSKIAKENHLQSKNEFRSNWLLTQCC
jgi:hypothetical protein